MRALSFPNIVRTFYTFANATSRVLPPQQLGLTPLINKAAGLRNYSMPIPLLSSLFSSAPSRNMTHPVQKSRDEWQAILSPGLCSAASATFLSPSFVRHYSHPVLASRLILIRLFIEQFRVIRDKGTESPYTGKYDQHMPSPSSTSTYNCAACSAPLYTASHKFKSGCGWPAFFDAIPGAVTRHEDRTFGMARTEIVCSNCGGHLGHVFKGEGYATPTDERHCVNSVSIDFGESEGMGKGSKA